MVNEIQNSLAFAITFWIENGSKKTWVFKN